MKRFIYLCFVFMFLFSVNTCKEEGRYEPKISGAAPGKVSDVKYTPLFGGVRLKYAIPKDEDLLQIQAEYTNEKGKTFLFTSSFYKDSLEVYGFSDIKEYTVNLYAVNRNGVRSEPVAVKVTPLEPAYRRVAKSMKVIPGFSALVVDWANELRQNINVFVELAYTKGGTPYAFTQVFSSNILTDRRFIPDLYLTAAEPLSVKIKVVDAYGNETESIDFGKVTLLEDMKIPKDKWVLPLPNDSVGGVPMCFGEGREGRNRYVIDDIIDRGDNLNFMHTNSRGRTGLAAHGNMPWNFIIDLGEYYELSRYVGHQRHSGGLANVNRGQYYQFENVGRFRLYVYDDATKSWGQPLYEHRIPVPVGISEIEFVRLGEAGDMCYFYPDNPQYTKPTRWFRFEAMSGFSGNYSEGNANCHSEITLYGRKAK